MAKKSAMQRFQATGQPFTRIEVVHTPQAIPNLDGTVDLATLMEHKVWGAVCEDKLVAGDDSSDPVWKPVYEEALVGQVGTLAEAYEVSAAWRGQTVGVYELR